MSDVNPAAEAARENARTDTGQFGTQSRTGPNALQASPAERFEAIFEEHMDDYYFDELDEFGGYENDDSCSELITVRDTLRNFYESQADMPDFDVSLISDTSGTIAGGPQDRVFLDYLLALVESLTAERDAAIAWRVEANRVHAARVESLREEFGKREDSQDRIRERLTAEVERLERWKFEACEVMSGLRELGKALGLRPGVQITGPAALAEVARLAAERDALIAVGKRQAARLARVEAYVLDEHGQSAGHAIEALAEEWDGDDSCDNRTCVPHRSADALRAALAGSDADTSDTQPTDQEDQS